MHLMDQTKQHGMTNSNSRRYYLHRKIRNFGAVVHSRQRLVEMEDKLFRFPTALLSTYLYKLNKLNYNIQSTIMLPEIKVQQNQVVKFVQKEDLIEKFKYVNSRLQILEKASLEIKVETEEQLTIAENNTKEIVQLRKEVDNTRKLMKAPYADIVKMVDGYCKIIDDSFERMKIRFTSQITDYKTIQQAALKAEKEAKVKEIEKLEAVKQEEADKIKRIEAQLIARIYGGVYVKRDGSQQSLAGCSKSSDCDDLLKWMNEFVPDISLFVHFSVLYEDMVIDVKKKLAAHRANLYNIEITNAPSLKKLAMQSINEARVTAVQDQQITSQTVDRLIEKDVKKEIRIIDNEISSAGKGVRNVLTFEVVDELLVTRDFLSVDETKVMNYLNANKEQIKQSVATGKDLVPGIRFFIDSNYVAR